MGLGLSMRINAVHCATNQHFKALSPSTELQPCRLRINPCLRSKCAQRHQCIFGGHPECKAPGGLGTSGVFDVRKVTLICSAKTALSAATRDRWFAALLRPCTKNVKKIDARYRKRLKFRDTRQPRFKNSSALVITAFLSITASILAGSRSICESTAVSGLPCVIFDMSAAFGSYDGCRSAAKRGLLHHPWALLCIKDWWVTKHVELGTKYIPHEGI